MRNAQCAIVKMATINSPTANWSWGVFGEGVGASKRVTARGPPETTLPRPSGRGCCKTVSKRIMPLFYSAPLRGASSSSASSPGSYVRCAHFSNLGFYLGYRLWRWFYNTLLLSVPASGGLLAAEGAEHAECASGGLLAAEEAEPAECASGGLRIPHFTLQIPF